VLPQLRWGLILTSLMLARVPAAQTIAVRFDQPTYAVLPGQPFTVQVLLDSDPRTSIADPLTRGLFSYGVKLTFNPLSASIGSVNAIAVPSALDFDGFDPGAQRAVGSGFAAVRGTINSTTFVPYGGTVLASVVITDLPTSGPYTLGLQLYQTLGNSEQVFLDGSGAVLDNSIAFGSATVADGNRDGDAYPDAIDKCPDFASTDQTDTDANGRGDRCECGDANSDGRVNVADIVAINLRIFTPNPVPALLCGPGIQDPCSLCDADNNNLCNVADIVAVNREIFSPGNTSTCARQPVPGP
jgi:hypothetical protein